MRLLLTLPLFLALAAPAAADSIVYTKDTNVWVARPDGTQARPVTSDGGYRSPSQADDGTILAVRGDKLYKLDRQGHPLAVFGYTDWKPTGAGELSRDGKRLAALRARATMGAGGAARGAWNSIQIYDVTSLTAPPAGACFIADDTGKEFGPPSWSPGGDQIAFARPDGIYTSPVCGVAPKLVIAGGNEPDWGPADPGAAAEQPKPEPTVTPAPKAKLASVKLGGRRLSVTVSCPAACSADAVAKRGKKVVGRGKGRAKQTGPAKIAMKVRGRGKVALTVKVRMGAASQTLTKAVR
jgi:hypothetical protein